MDELDELEEIEFEHAITSAGFGKFNIFHLLVCGAVYAVTALGVTVLSFVLPAAACDFEMSSTNKGVLSGAPMIGMLVGSYFWGCLADTKGRKIVLVYTLILDGICGIVSSAMPIYTLFLALRLCNGFLIAGAMGICFSYLGEFQATKYRETVLSWMELFWTIGLLWLPLIAWVVIPLDIQFGHFKSWNLFVAISSLPSLVIGIALLYFPESPKFLLEVGEPEAALRVLKRIYVMNSGKTETEYPVNSLRETEREYKYLQRHQSIRRLRIHRRKELSILLRTFWDQTKELCRPPNLKLTLLTCFLQVGILTSYYTLMMWFPELFDRFERYERTHPNETTSVCEVSEVRLENNIDCDNPIGEQVFVHTLIVGMACVPTSCWLLMCVRKLGAKFFLMFSLTIASISVIFLYYVTNSTQNLMLSCLFESMASLASSASYSVMVDLFPTNLRVMATSLALTVGRVGAVLGNMMFGYLIDIHCFVPIIIFATSLMCSAILCMFLPETGQESLG
ncbi:synaptic vesicle glycoprotein 2C-like [Culicoides brevitarsis]|uniref:synaptic vesicle glycoprotein 2C-like n=1 Tax=Culicoides brevitarsis TaxID=469753 RepID=UPI00307B221D